MRHPAFAGDLGREQLLDWYRRARSRSRAIFDMVGPETYYERPIALRNPIVFYEGHLPAFCVNTLVKLAGGREGIDPHFESLFERGIDPEDEASAKSPTDMWPERERVLSFAAACDELIEETLRSGVLEDDRVPQLRGGEAVLAIIEHEFMHQETLLYMFQELPYAKKNRAAAARVLDAGAHRPSGSIAARGGTVSIPAGTATLGAERGSQFGWDNEFPQQRVDVGEFSIDALNVTNGDYLEYMQATGAGAPHFWARGERDWSWRGMLENLPLDLRAPVYVTHAEAEEYARWKGTRLPTEAEFHRAAYGTPEGTERLQPWGDAPADSSRGNFGFAAFEPVAAGSFPAGASAWGVHDLVGNGWEWTSSLFAGFPGFEPMPSYARYSADFFDEAHYVMKGASPVTSYELVRRTFRNWFRPNYPYMFATFRCVSAR